MFAHFAGRSKKLQKKFDVPIPLWNIRFTHRTNKQQNMRTKTLLLSAAVFAAGFTASLAQSLYSVNAVGYVNLSLPAGYTMIANPLNTTNNTIGSLITDFPNFGNLLKWNGTGFTVATFAFGSWDQPNITLNPGEGAFVNIGSPFTLTFVGDVMQGSLTNPIPAGYSIRASQVPQSGGVSTTLGLTQLGTFDNLLVWTGSGYQIYTVLPGGAWDPSEPQINVGQSFFVNASAPTSWQRTFSVN